MFTESFMNDKINILVVDDEPVVRQLLEAILVPEGYQLFFGVDGDEALKKAAEIFPDIILLDVMMPKMDGFEVCKQIRQLNATAHIPIFLITALDDRDSRIRGIAAGADDYISKPFDRIEILAKIRNKANQISIRGRHARVIPADQPEKSRHSYNELLVESLIWTLNPDIPDSEVFQSHRSKILTESRNLIMTRPDQGGQFYCLISNRLMMNDSVIVNSIYKQLLINNLNENISAREPDLLFETVGKQISQLSDELNIAALKNADFSVVAIYHDTYSGEITISGIHQQIFVCQSPSSKDNTQSGLYQVFPLQDKSKLSFKTPGVVFLFSPEILKEIRHQEIITFLNTHYTNASATDFSGRIKEYFNKFEDFIVMRLKY